MSPFAALEAATNASVLRHLANARVRFDGAVDEVEGVFVNPSSVAALGIGADDTSPSVTVASSAVPANPAEQLVAIDGVPYRIVRPIPDGTGLTRLTVERTQ